MNTDIWNARGSNYVCAGADCFVSLMSNFMDKYGGDKYFDDNKLKKGSNKNLGSLQNMVRSKSKNAGKSYWRVKTDRGAFDFNIAEEIILTDKLDVSKYVKRIILQKSNWDYKNKNIIELVNEKYPHIEVVEVDRYKGYADIKKALKQKEKTKEKVLQEKKNIKVYEDQESDHAICNGCGLSDPFLFDEGEEPSGSKFKIGDYVMVWMQSRCEYYKYPYKLEHYYLNPSEKPFPRLHCFVTINTFSRQWVFEDELRLATIEEIEEDELKKAQLKYNI